MGARAAAVPAGAGAAARLEGGLRGLPARQAAASGGALHGLRHPVLQQRLPARQPDPRLERPRLPRPLAGRDRSPARDQQLPRVHRPAVPGAVRVVVRARDQPASRHDQAGRGRDHRPGVGRGLGDAAPPDGQDRQARRRRSDRARRASPPPSSSPAPATTSSCSSAPTGSAACCATASPSSRWRSATSIAASSRWRRRAPSSARTRSWVTTSTSTVLQASYDAIVLACGATAWRDLPDARARAGQHPSGDGVPAADQPCAARRHRALTDRRQRQARRDHRRRRHRRRLPRNSASPGRGVGHATRDPAPPARRPGRHQPVAAVRVHVQGHVGARRGRRADLRRQHRTLHR